MNFSSGNNSINYSTLDPKKFFVYYISEMYRISMYDSREEFERSFDRNQINNNNVSKLIRPYTTFLYTSIQIH